ncbi:hypothetical protein GQ43DRAFT_60955 [Delitschia confertaspora ATCC 74209]|uniref:Uncharacterized protein n=1 Tax=Delitschia confertaspora ATCC 74209 TaxID=1513339 RepID=A0A9P4JJV2_9PLEO|nr:hypothetical protein GQ43DRAFT_60955 [Delitschia confertaspora ATCC 74209]
MVIWRDTLLITLHGLCGGILLRFPSAVNLFHCFIDINSPIGITILTLFVLHLCRLVSVIHTNNITPIFPSNPTQSLSCPLPHISKASYRTANLSIASLQRSAGRDMNSHLYNAQTTFEFLDFSLDNPPATSTEA